MTTPATTTRPPGTRPSCRDRRRGSSARCSKHASRSTSPIRPSRKAFEWPSGPSALAGWDGTTYGHSLGARFLTRDPLEALTREPYGYGGGNPANNVDPTGLDWTNPATWTPVDWAQEQIEDACVEHLNPDGCDTIAEQNPEMAQGIVDFSSGVLDVNPITWATNSLGLSDTGQYANECSGWFRTGQVAMLVAGLVVPAGHSTRVGDAAFRSRIIGADSFLFGNSSLGATARSGILNPAGRGLWRLGWGVNGVPVFRAKVAGRYVDLLVTSGF